MDAKQSGVDSETILSNDDNLYRIVQITVRDKKDKKIPAVRCFSLSPSDKRKLSVDYEKLTTPEECIARIGCQFKRDSNDFKSYDDREIYAIDVGFLNEMDAVKKVMMDPLFHLPERKGFPDNPSHSLIVFQDIIEDEPEVFLRIRDQAKDKMVEVEMSKVHEIVKSYRES